MGMSGMISLIKAHYDGVCMSDMISLIKAHCDGVCQV